MSKCIYKELAEKLNKEEVAKYYETHLTKDVCEHFNIDRKYFYRIFHYLEIPLRTISENTKMQMELCDHTELSKKISERNKGKVVSEETKRKQSESNKGKKRSE